MQRYLAVVVKIGVKVPIQKPSVSQSVTHQNAVILPPILFAVSERNQFLTQVRAFVVNFIATSIHV